MFQGGGDAEIPMCKVSLLFCPLENSIANRVIFSSLPVYHLALFLASREHLRMDADHMYLLYVSKVLLIPCIMKLGDKDTLCCPCPRGSSKFFNVFNRPDQSVKRAAIHDVWASTEVCFLANSSLKSSCLNYSFENGLKKIKTYCNFCLLRVW